ncbi:MULTISPECIES: capsular polysaccharide export protein, LipB/KpsS family [unclassified Citrobacter freundii complex]|uniref:capsular polysaccharide export protein, LipB/KpsS family n=1 Tax=unclassified Citrobacter freundii complex TaxID=2816438 RepID=UPI000CD24E35|nr:MULTISPECIES: capsular biosynthesis protein [unclassified Citrobacter freundii complex]AUV28042.1 capsular biosynthesis protein [Citrobacter freundii complex sp. CFNIH3]POV59118.1 capsular biosynthesis protein [Citrobacter freundii complex sp. CFNIH5]
MKVTIVIPLRVTPDVYQAKERLESIISNVPDDKFNILIIDYGTEKQYLHIFDGVKCNNVKIIRCDSEDRIFSIGHARDIGVQHSEDDVVIFNDIDFYANRNMYDKIYYEVLSRDMVNNRYDFFCVPVFFLTENGTKTLHESKYLDDAVFNNWIHKKIVESHNDFVDFPAYGSSAIVVNKYHYLAIGGHCREFYGHGAEDYDVLHRLASYYAKGPRTVNYYENTKNNDIVSYKGFRAYFSLYGIDIFSRAIYFQHLWHPKRTIPGYQQTQRNFSLLDRLMKDFDRDRIQPYPLSDYRVKNKTLLLVDTNSQTFKAIRHATPALGELVFLSENLFEHPIDIVKYVEDNSIDRVLLLNPYGNEHRLSLYQEIKNNNIDFIIFDRGALPNSWFFDSCGFNYESSSYDTKSWENDLSKDQLAKTKEYIFDLCNSENTLEANSPRQTARHLREKYQVGNRKVLFVPFQRPTDTVTTYFAGAAGSVQGFQEWVTFIASKLSKRNWLIVCKNHPLEKELPKIDGVLYADDGTHIHDLIDLADKVFLMNSGVGVISLAFMKPVICASQAFYSHDGLAVEAHSPEEALQLINSNLSVDRNRVYKFYWHLINNVYSFGVSKYKKTKASDGSNRSIVTEIIFEYINIAGSKIELGKIPSGVSLDAPLFYSFGGRMKIKKDIELQKAQSKPSKTPISKPIVDRPSAAIKSVAQTDAIIVNDKFKRKVRKLFRNPALFMRDALNKH